MQQACCGIFPGVLISARTGAEVSRATGSNRPTDAQIAPYWQRVITANQSTLRSGNPSLIFPGEIVTLPTPPAVF